MIVPSRPRLATAGLVLAIVTGLGSRLVPVGVYAWDESAGDVAYAVMIGFAVELFRLTNLPSREPRVVRFALGDTFAWHDLGCYVVGVVLVGACAAAHARITAPKNASG